MITSSADGLHLKDQPQNDDEIDLRELINTLSRRWRWLAGCSTLGLILSSLYLIITKPIYQGEFQIVIRQEKNQAGSAALLAKNPALAALAGLGGAGVENSIGTELQVLNSPSVLRPVFDAVKARKPPKEARNMKFEDWLKMRSLPKKKKEIPV